MKAEQTSSPALLPFEVNKKRQGKGKGKEGKGRKGRQRRKTQDDNPGNHWNHCGNDIRRFAWRKGKWKHNMTQRFLQMYFYVLAHVRHCTICWIYLISFDIPVVFHVEPGPWLFHQNSHQFRSLVLIEWTWGTSWILWPWIWNDQCKHTSKLLCKCCLADQFVCPRRVERTVCLGTYRKDNSWWYLMTDLKCILHIVKYKRFHFCSKAGYSWFVSYDLSYLNFYINILNHVGTIYI